jgi:DNA polymerase-1
MSDTSPPPAARPRLFLIDGYSNVFRAFYAIRNLSSSKGEPTNAVYGFVQMLRKLLKDEQPELIGVAWDGPEPTVRSDKFQDYKAHRKPMPEDLKPQIPYIRRVLEAYRIPVLEFPRYEADDVLGTLAAKAEVAGYDVVLVSADKDLMQLVTPGVRLFHTGRSKLYDPAGVKEDFGVPPEQVADVLGVMGDAVDNIPGVPGIGEKGAKALIAEYGSLEALLDKAGEISRKSYREGLLAHREQALLSKELSTIHTDLDVPFDPEALRLDPPDDRLLKELFTELEFFSLAEEIQPAGTDEAPPVTEVTSAAELSAAAAALAGETFALLLGDGAPVALVFGAVEGEAPPLLVDLRRPGLRDAAVTVITGWFAEEGRELVGHDLKEALRLCPPGSPCRARLFDLMLASYVIRPSAHNHGLAELAFERLGRKLATWKEVGFDRDAEPPPGDPRLSAAAGERAATATALVAPMRRELGDGDLARVYGDIELPLLPVLLAMEQHGIALDVPYLQAMSVELAREIGDLEEEIFDLAGERFNIGSPQQLGVILFERLQYPILKRTRKTKSYATGAEVLEELAGRGYPLPERILRYRELTKLKSTYVDALPVLVAADGRLHTTYQQAVAATGRLSSVNPNLQNIPVRTELGQRIRRAFVAPPGRLLLVADYSQIELRILAHIAQEPTFLDAFRAGQDIHRSTAALVFGASPELVTADQRRAAKTINFGILYGMSAFGLSQNLHIPPKEAERFIDAYLGRLPRIREYMDDTLAMAEQEGKVSTLYGRVRYLPDIHSKNWNLRENARRMAINARIQGTAADILKIAMIRVARRLAEETPAAWLLLSVHDELVLEVPEGEEERVGALVREEMEGVCRLDAPLTAELGWGKSWYEAKE